MLLLLTGDRTYLQFEKLQHSRSCIKKKVNIGDRVK